MKKFLLLFIFLIPSFVYAEDLIPNAKSGVLMEANSGKIIFEKEKDMEVSIASMTKMVAQIIILEQIEKGIIKWTDVVTASKNASDMGGSQIYLEQGEKMSVEDLMKGISVASGNDATVAMAEFIAGNEKKFVEMMNKKVKELGLKHTHFSNCTGLDEDNHYSSSYDMALIARELIVNHPDILRFSSIYEDYLREDSDRKFWLVNTNKLVSQYEGTDGLKTGHTDNAGYCLAATTKRNDLRLIAIVLGENDSKVRNQETIQLLDYGFSNVKSRILKKKGSVVKKISIPKSDKKNVSILLKDNLSVVEDVGDKGKYESDIQLNKLSLPIKKNSIVGHMKVLRNNKFVSSSPLVIAEDVKRLNIIDLYLHQLQELVYGNF